MVIQLVGIVLQIAGLLIFMKAILNLYHCAKHGEPPEMGFFMLMVSTSMLLVTLSSIDLKDGNSTRSNNETASIDSTISKDEVNPNDNSQRSSMTIDSF